MEESRVKSQSLHRFSLRRFNNILTVVIIAVNLYIIVLPLWPQVTFLWRKQTDKTAGVPYIGTLAEQQKPGDTTVRGALPDDDRLVIPALALNEHIYEGVSPYTVNKGVWRRPNTSTPDKGGNTVLVGHRFTYKNPAVFYHLDVMKKGDHFAVYWKKRERLYEVTEVRTVAATALEIEAPTTREQLTIYTCTPLWTAKNRLVVIARPLPSSRSMETPQ